jgi:hypothetical protein
MMGKEGRSLAGAKSSEINSAPTALGVAREKKIAARGAKEGGKLLSESSRRSANGQGSRGPVAPGQD